MPAMMTADSVPVDILGKRGIIYRTVLIPAESHSKTNVVYVKQKVTEETSQIALVLVLDKQSGTNVVDATVVQLV